MHSLGCYFCLLPPLLCNSGNKHQNNPPMSPSLESIHYSIYQFIVECFLPNHEECEFTNSHGTGTFVCPIKYRSRNRHLKLQEDDVFPHDDVWFGLDTKTCAFVYSFIFKCLTDGVCNLYLDWGRDSLWWHALSRYWLSCTRCWQYFPCMKWLMYAQ